MISVIRRLSETRRRARGLALKEGTRSRRLHCLESDCSTTMMITGIHVNVPGYDDLSDLPFIKDETKSQRISTKRRYKEPTASPLGIELFNYDDDISIYMTQAKTIN
ncbi:unnamed protein product [Arctia plantaginis]|uniref:Uncharacterized protein n=1 Tax=Arctia plantaginis TaxID=874455 RepID=A0A8S1AGJ0_ARCPL|nr:unnamed protein product [Arctia plantaginis]